jgi:transposase
MTLWLFIDDQPTKTRRRFTAQQKAEAVALCLSEGLSCTAVAQRLGLPNSSLAKWVRQARNDRGDFGPPEQGQLTSDERAEQAQLRKEIRKLRWEKDFSGWRQLTLQKSSCRREVSPDRLANRPVSCVLAVPTAGCGAQRLLRLAATTAEPGLSGPGERGPLGPGAGRV